jgi:hypothetical protein
MLPGMLLILLTIPPPLKTKIVLINCDHKPLSLLDIDV